MAKLINAKCPNCGATLELPETLDRAFCMHCGGKVIIAKDEVHHHHGAKAAIACPECGGRGDVTCLGGLKELNVENNSIYFSGCNGSGGCKPLSINPIPLSFKKQAAIRNVSIYADDPSILNRLKTTCSAGKCVICEGKGQIKTLLSSKKCDYCNGTGICQICNGTGLCIFCDGTGKISCEACNGTGFKTYNESKTNTNKIKEPKQTLSIPTESKLSNNQKAKAETLYKRFKGGEKLTPGGLILLQEAGYF